MTNGYVDMQNPRSKFSFFAPEHLLNLSYPELEARNLEIKSQRLKCVSSDDVKSEMLDMLKSEQGVKSVVLSFSDLEGCLHTLDYDKNFIIDSYDNLTFDGSSINGFSDLCESDLRLKVDWTSFRWLPADLFGAGKIMVFANVCNADGSYYESDFRSNLLLLSEELHNEGMLVNVAPEIEGFLFRGCHAEQIFNNIDGFELATMSGYFNSLPKDTLRIFIDKLAEVKRALGFQNEKDHPEVAPAQFELNYKYSIALDAADQIQLYKLLARQIAKTMGFTASFLPKPVANLNGSGMHINMSISESSKNLFYDAKGEYCLSDLAHKFVNGVLYEARGLCLIMNSSVNSYRRLDPNYEAPNEIKTSSNDRSAMVRIPMGNEKSARMEVRTVAPDVNPYMCIYALIRAGVNAMKMKDSDYKIIEKDLSSDEVAKLPGNIYDAMDDFKDSEFISAIFGNNNVAKYLKLKESAAERSPKILGSRVKAREILDHHEVTNQLLWADF